MSKPLTDAAAVKKFLAPELSTREFMTEYKALSTEDKKELGELCREELTATEQA